MVKITEVPDVDNKSNVTEHESTGSCAGRSFTVITDGLKRAGNILKHPLVIAAAVALIASIAFMLLGVFLQILPLAVVGAGLFMPAFMGVGAAMHHASQQT